MYTLKKSFDIRYNPGEHLNNLTIIEFYRRGEGNNYYWCKCDCGETFLARENDIINNYVTSCGHDKHHNIKDDISGNKYGELEVIRFNHYGHARSAYYLCKCSCGNYSIARRDGLIHYRTKSCGCLSQQARIDRMTTHGLSDTRFYNIWQHIVDRCTNPQNDEYYNYGGRGITLDPRWLTFENFRDDMYDEYIQKTNEVGDEKLISIDRKNVNGNYYKENCWWVTWDIQSNNKRNNIHVNLGENSCSLMEAYNKFHNPSLTYACVRDRIMKLGIDPLTALCLPLTIKASHGENREIRSNIVNNSYSPISLMNSIQIQKYENELKYLKQQDNPWKQ